MDSASKSLANWWEFQARNESKSSTIFTMAKELKSEAREVLLRHLRKLMVVLRPKWNGR